jgi:hypothetical protein
VRNLARLAPLVVAFCLVAAACGSEGEAPDDGPVRQAIEQLRDFGLTEAQASCVVDRIGADTVDEAGDLTALAESEAYRAAAEACVDAS